MLKKQIFSLIKFTRARLYNSRGSTSGFNVWERKDPVQKDPNIEISGKAPRTGKERVEEWENQITLSSMPKDLLECRTAHIYQRSKHVMQQGINNTDDWILEFGHEQRWENPTMGWSSSGDPISNIHMVFPSLCAAVCFAENQGLKWTHVKPRPKKVIKKSYAEIFAWNRRTRVSTK